MTTYLRMLSASVLPVLLVFSMVGSVYAQQDWRKVGSAREQYEMFTDTINRHDGESVTSIKSNGQLSIGFGALMSEMKPEKYFGKRVKMTGEIKSKDVSDWAGLWLRVDQAGSEQALAFDNMHERRITGTTGWQTFAIVLDVPTNASNIAFGALLSKSGQIWIDNIHFEIVDNSISTTDRLTH